MPEPSERIGRGETVGERIARFTDPLLQGEPPPSFALIAPLESRGGEVTGPPVRFFSTGSTSGVVIATEPGTSLYGTGEVCGRLERTGTLVRCWNTDAYQYDDRNRSLYQSHPWVLAVRRDGSAFGVLADTTWPCEIDLRAGPGPRGIEFRCEGPPPAVYVIVRDSPMDIVRELARLTGFMPMPPMWALGYHQCRYSYFPDSRVTEIARELRRRRLPCDAIWMDIDYMDGFRCFTFDPDRFPDPRRLNADLHAMHFHNVWMIDCGIKVDPAYAVYREGREGGHFVTTASGEEYHGSVWPGPCAFPDYLRVETRRWWAELYRDFLARGIDGVWNDMNEPSVFDGPGKTMPVDNRHRADADLGGPDAHARYHNVYGMQMVRATREGVAHARPDARPFVLTRSNFIGGQRYAATWTGDNTSNEDHLQWSIPMVLNLGLSGQPFSGPDIGGYDQDATPDLFARWMGIGALLPFARGHTETKTGPHEPWAFGEACERACRIALQRRYRLMPYLYTLFREAATTGAPIVRPVFFADPADASLRTVDDAFLLGSDVLVVPPWSTLDPARLTGGWRRGSITADDHPALPAIWIRAGAAVPIGPDMQYVSERPLDPLTLLCNPDSSGLATCTLYEDAGDGHGHERGQYALTRYAVEGSVIRRERIAGDWPTPERREVIACVASTSAH